MRPVQTRYVKTLCLCLLIACTNYALCQGNAPGKTVTKSGIPDKALLAKFRLVCRQLDDFKGNYTMGGIITVDNKSAPGQKITKTDFLFCKNGEEFFYKMGRTITLNEQGVYLCMDLAAKTITLSPQKKVVYDARLKQFADVGNTIQSENYEMKNSVRGNEQTISLINEHHITCKQYAISFDKRTLRIRRLYVRLTNPQDPSRTDNEEIVDVSINRWDHKADLSEFHTASNIIKNVNGRWVVKSEYKNYRLINM